MAHSRDYHIDIVFTSILTLMTSVTWWQMLQTIPVQRAVLSQVVIEFDGMSFSFMARMPHALLVALPIKDNAPTLKYSFPVAILSDPDLP